MIDNPTEPPAEAPGTHAGRLRLEIDVRDGDRAEHPIVAGLSTWEMRTEQYWMLADGLSDVLATTRFAATAETPWRRDVVSPAVYTRRWGAGRVFVSTIGHKLDDLDMPPVRTLTERGLLWAARR